MMKKRHKAQDTRNRRGGFTLIELLTAVSIFAVIMVISMGSILGVFDANRKSRTMRSVMANLNLAMESMSKEIRFGTIYHCGPGLPTPENCPEGSSTMSFQAEDDSLITYRLNGQTIEKTVSGGETISLTAPEVVIDDLDFYVLGSGTDNTLQPKVVIRIKAHAGTDRGRTDLSIQTLVSQREPDI